MLIQIAYDFLYEFFRTTDKEEEDKKKKEKKERKEKERIKKSKKEEEEDEGGWVAVKGGVAIPSEKPKMFPKDAEIDINVVVQKLNEIVAARGLCQCFETEYRYLFSFSFIFCCIGDIVDV